MNALIVKEERREKNRKKSLELATTDAERRLKAAQHQKEREYAS